MPASPCSRHVELSAAFVGADMPEGFLGHVQAGWRDIVDRLATSPSLRSISPAR